MISNYLIIDFSIPAGFLIDVSVAHQVMRESNIL